MGSLRRVALVASAPRVPTTRRRRHVVLAAAGVVVKKAGGWVLAPDGDREAIEELVEAWSTNGAAVLNVMTQRSIGRIRASVARTFADAFLLRRGGKSEGGEDDG